ncbi:MAG: two-component sensor histidine kinase [Myxococcales bacterium]|nr:two-component sensor histidine kinase [Myxococcales bacterium]
MRRPKDGHDPISAVPMSGPQQRSSDVVFPRGEQPSSSRSRSDSTLPPAWGERLLRIVWETPQNANDEEVMREVVSALCELLPGVAVGAASSRVADAAQTAVVHLVRSSPHEEIRVDVVSTVEGPLFPAQAHEAVVSVPTDDGQVALHVAADDPDTVSEASLALAALRRAILLLARNLENARLTTVGAADGEAKRVLAAQMVQADKLASLGQIAAGMVHELNNPLTSIVAYSEYLVKRWLARTDQVDPHELERLERISTSANRLLRFTRDLVTYARPATETLAPIAIQTIVDQAVIFCEHLLSEHKTTVVRSYAEGSLAIRGSGEQLTQVFVNLFTNACHAMATGGTITVMTDLDANGQSVRVVVEDAGHGIDAANLGRVFAPFFTTKAAGTGTGLGLSIVKSIVDAHQGRIWAESEPQKGARFVIVLPRA